MSCTSMSSEKGRRSLTATVSASVDIAFSMSTTSDSSESRTDAGGTLVFGSSVSSSVGGVTSAALMPGPDKKMSGKALRSRSLMMAISIVVQRRITSFRPST